MTDWRPLTDDIRGGLLAFLVNFAGKAANKRTEQISCIEGKNHG